MVMLFFFYFKYIVVDVYLLIFNNDKLMEEYY